MSRIAYFFILFLVPVMAIVNRLLLFPKQTMHAMSGCTSLTGIGIRAMTQSTGAMLHTGLT